MSTRTYNQICPVAYSLDVIGDRWTMLIVRELLLGPRRFTDIERWLPGIGTNLLSLRLKELESAELIQKRTLPPPAASTVYALTERGMSLRKVMDALVEFGLPYIYSAQQETDFLSLSSLMLIFTYFFNKKQAEGADIAIEFHVSGDVSHVRVQNQQIEAGYGVLSTPKLIIEIETITLMLLAQGKISLEQVQAEKNFKVIAGYITQLEQFLTIYRS